MACGSGERQKPIARNRGRIAIVQWMVVEAVVLQHRRVENRCDAGLRVVNEGKGRDRAGAHAQNLPEKVPVGKREPGSAQGPSEAIEAQGAVFERDH